MRKTLILSLVFVTHFAFAKDVKPVAMIEVSEAKIFVPLKGTNATAGYATVKNVTEKEVTLKVSKVEPFKAVETHVTKEKEGHMAMEKVESFKIPAKGTLELKPGGNHIMLFDAGREVKIGEELVVQFWVDGTRVDTKFKVETRTDASGAHSGH